MKELNNAESGVFRGTKDLKAWPMTKSEYCDYRGWDVPADEDGDEAGYLVEYLDGGKANDDRHSGYISWSPGDVFERTYYRIDASGGAMAQEDTSWQEESRRMECLRIAGNVMAGRGSIAGEVVKAAQQYEEFLRGPETADNAD